MKSNSGTKTTFNLFIVVLVVFLAIGVIGSISKEKNLVAQSEVKYAIEEKSNIQYKGIQSRRLNNDEDVSTRHISSSRFENEIIEQKETEAEKLRIEAEEKRRVMIENIKNISISVNMDLTQRTGLTKEEFKLLMEHVSADKSKFFYKNSELIYNMCEKYSLNEIFFCGLISAESGWNIAENHRRTYNYISLMSNGKLIQYKSLEDGLEVAAKVLHDKYLTEGGSFYFGKTLSAVKTRFCPASPTWVNLVYGRMEQISKAKNIEM